MNARTEHEPVRQRQPAALLPARAGVALAASAPMALVVAAALPATHPAAIVPGILAMIAAALLVWGTELVTFEHQFDHVNGKWLTVTLGPPASHQPSLADPGALSVERWLGRWPGMAGVTAVAWWAARAGIAGLLVRLAFAASGLPLRMPLEVTTIACLVGMSLLPVGRHLVHAAVGLVAVLGTAVSAVGLVAVASGRLTAPILARGPLWPTGAAAGATIIESTTTVVLLCLPAVALVAVAPATSGSGRTGWVTVLGAGLAISCWLVAVPLLLRAGGLGWSSLALNGPTGSLVTSLSKVLVPAAGAKATLAARWTLFAGALAGATGALSGATAIANSSFRATTLATDGRKKRPVLTGPVARWARSGDLPSRSLGLAAGLSALGATVIALQGPSMWLLVTLGAAATSALALTTIAPPLGGKRNLLPNIGRAGVAATWAVVVTVALGAAGPRAMVTAGLGTLVGLVALAWASSGGPVANWRERRAGVPWETMATALVTVSAVITLEVLSASAGKASATMWRSLAVVVMAAGIAVLGVIPANSRLWVERLTRAASTLADRTLPSLVATLENTTAGQSQRASLTELTSLKAAMRPLEGSDNPPEHLRPLADAIGQMARQALRVAAAVDSAAGLDGRRLEELVEARTSAIAHVNRTIIGNSWQRRQLFDRTVRVAESERAHLAANLHDGPIQRLATLGLVLDRCKLRLERDDKEAAAELIGRARTELAGEIGSLRRMMSDLRPPVLDEGGLESALADQLASWSEATGIGTCFEPADHGALSGDNETVAYRVVQEALANVAKHAKASLVTVSLRPEGDGTVVTVRDDGKGFKTPPEPDLLRQGHFGLALMRERVELAGGRFEIVSAWLSGTEVRAWLPSLEGKALEAPLEAPLRAGAGGLAP